MYKSISEVPKEELQKMKENSKAWGIVFREIEPADFKEVICREGKRAFTKENLISEINKIDSFPDYTILISEWKDIHVIFYGQDSLTEEQNKKITKVFKEIFGVVSYC